MSSGKSEQAKANAEDMEKFHEFQQEIENLQEQVQNNQVLVQEKINAFFESVPQISEIKKAYADSKFPLQTNISIDLSK